MVVFNLVVTILSLWFATVMSQCTSCSNDKQLQGSKELSILANKVHQLQEQNTRQHHLLEGLVEVIGNQSAEQKCPGQSHQYSRNCVDVQRAGHTQSGEYTVAAYVDQYGPAFVKVYCDMDTGGGGWLVFQRRQDGSVDFYRNWNDYAYGFGSVSGEFWLGNTFLHFLTSQFVQELRIDMRDGNRTYKFALYDHFHVGAAATKFILTVSGYQGTAGDSFTQHSGYRFTTRDEDNDADNGANCAETFSGAWWYENCHWSNLNGLYLNGSHSSYANGVEWKAWHGYHHSLPFTEMKIRPLTTRKG